MRHCGTHTIETQNLILRPLELDDAEVMFDNWANDPIVTRYLRWRPHRSWTETFEYLNEMIKHYSEPDFYYWGITQKSTGILLGTISIQRCEDVTDWQYTGMDWRECWEPGYVLGEKWWNRGYATEALQAVCEYWFDNTGAMWLAASHARNNLASARVLQKVGFVYDHETENHRFDGTPIPSCAYFLTRQDFLRPDGVLSEYEEEPLER